MLTYKGVSIFLVPFLASEARFLHVKNQAVPYGPGQVKKREGWLMYIMKRSLTNQLIPTNCIVNNVEMGNTLYPNLGTVHSHLSQTCQVDESKRKSRVLSLFIANITL